MHWDRPRFHQFEGRATLVGDPPTASIPLDQSLREDVQTGNAFGQPDRTLGPVPPARRKDGHIAPYVGQNGPAARVAHQGKASEPLSTTQSPSASTADQGPRQGRVEADVEVSPSRRNGPIGYFCPDGAWAFELFGLALLASGLLAS